MMVLFSNARPNDVKKTRLVDFLFVDDRFVGHAD